MKRIDQTGAGDSIRCRFIHAMFPGIDDVSLYAAQSHVAEMLSVNSAWVI